MSDNFAELAKERALKVQELLAKRYPKPQSELIFTNAWQLLVATVLAAQCTDARVNLVTPTFFQNWPEISDLAKANLAEIEAVIKSTGFYHNKAKNLLATAKKITQDFNGQVPQTMPELLTLAGVARKTANVVLYGAFGINVGIAVDTHVKRISQRLGLVQSQTPEKIEQELMLLFPKEEWGALNHRLVLFGRKICLARKPNCQECEMQTFCPSYQI